MTGTCRSCGKPTERNIHYPCCSQDCGITDYYDRLNARYREEFAAWEASDPKTRGPFESTVYFD